MAETSEEGDERAWNEEKNQSKMTFEIDFYIGNRMASMNRKLSEQQSNKEIESGKEESARQSIGAKEAENEEEDDLNNCSQISLMGYRPKKDEKESEHGIQKKEMNGKKANAIANQKHIGMPVKKTQNKVQIEIDLPVSIQTKRPQMNQFKNFQPLSKQTLPRSRESSLQNTNKNRFFTPKSANPPSKHSFLSPKENKPIKFLSPERTKIPQNNPQAKIGSPKAILDAHIKKPSKILVDQPPKKSSTSVGKKPVSSVEAKRFSTPKKPQNGGCPTKSAKNVQETQRVPPIRQIQSPKSQIRSPKNVFPITQQTPNDPNAKNEDTLSRGTLKILFSKVTPPIIVVEVLASLVSLFESSQESGRLDYSKVKENSLV